ncbi:MAG: matrixin family metalloprotease [Candidatus Obscuribacter sp.]|nr:matrixin family metalloprotease [Candidatus Obscuribacter sp.]
MVLPWTLGRMKAAATHEFGHALGIEGHSTNPQDLMSMYYGRGVISPNDAATLRYLYCLQPDLIL